MKTKIFFASLFIIFILMNITTTCHDNNIEINDLPESAQNFIGKYFSLDSIKTITISTKEKDYKIKFFNHSEIIFNKKGIWQEVETKNNPFPIALFDILPANIFQYIITVYPQRPVSSIRKTTYGYKIEVGVTKKQEIKFDLEGNVTSK